MADNKRTEKIFEYVELNYNNLTRQVNNWLSTTYNKSGILFNSSSPYGQLLTQMKEFFRWITLYNKNTVRQLDIEQTNTKRMILNLARISGHNPSRAISAKGSLKFKLKQGINIDQKIQGSSVVIYDGTTLKSRTNSLFYTLKIGVDRNIYSITSGCQFFVNIVQGKYETQTFTGDGSKNQSIAVIVDNNQTIDNFDFQVFVDGVNMSIRDHLYDMLENENACFTRTGFDGGLDVYFGNSVNGIVPPLGSVIEVKYLLTDGIVGNIPNSKINDFEFVDDIYDSEGNIISSKELFDVFIENDITFASDGESLEYTKSIIPYVSRNFVLATPSQFIYHLKKLNFFSKVNAFNTLDMVEIDIDADGDLDNININEMYLFLIPKITNYFVGDINYFNVPLDAFFLDSYEKSRIIEYLKKQGIISLTAKITILDPTISMYIANVYVRRYDDEPEENIRNQIINYLSDYFANNERYDRIVKADIIKGLKGINGIDSVNIEFVSKSNEDYHRDGAVLNQQRRTVIETTYATNIKSVAVESNKLARGSVSAASAQRTDTSYKIRDAAKPTKVDDRLRSSDSQVTSLGSTTLIDYKKTNYNENELLGIDPVLGDIIINKQTDNRKNQLAILRGGWSDRNGIYYYEDPGVTDGFSTVNIIFKDNEPEITRKMKINDNSSKSSTSTTNSFSVRSKTTNSN